MSAELTRKKKTTKASHDGNGWIADIIQNIQGIICSTLQPVFQLYQVTIHWVATCLVFGLSFSDVILSYPWKFVRVEMLLSNESCFFLLWKKDSI